MARACGGVGLVCVARACSGGSSTVFAGGLTLTPCLSRAVRLPLMVPRCVPTPSTTDGIGDVPVRRVARSSKLDVASLSPPSPPAPPPPLFCRPTATTRTFLLATTSSCKRTRRRVSGRSLRPKTPSPSWCPSPTALASRGACGAAAALRALFCWVLPWTSLFVLGGTVLHLVRLVSVAGWGYDCCVRHRHQFCFVCVFLSCRSFPPSRRGVTHRAATRISEDRHISRSTDVRIGTLSGARRGTQSIHRLH